MFLRRYRGTDGEIGYNFYCPACALNEYLTGVHSVRTAVGSRNPSAPAWTFNENLSAPTFGPSVRVMYGTLGDCHFFIEDGVFKYCADSHHIHLLRAHNYAVAPDGYIHMPMVDWDDGRDVGVIRSARRGA